MTIVKISTEQIASILDKAFEPETLQVYDDAGLHAGHTHSGAGHFRIKIQSHMFNGETRIQTHRMIYEILEPFMDCGIHALSIDAKPV